MTTLIDEIRICWPGLRGGSSLLPSISFDWACSQNILLLCAPNGNGALRALTILVPQLFNWAWSFYGVCCHFVLIKEPFWVVTRPHLLDKKAKQIRSSLQNYVFKKIMEIHRWRLWTWILWSLRNGWSKAGWWDMWTQSMMSPSGLYLNTKYQ